MKEDNDEYLKK